MTTSSNQGIKQMENDIKQRLINYISNVRLTDQSKRIYSPSQKAIADFKLTICLNNQAINIYRFIDLYNRIYQNYQKATKSSLKPVFKWTGSIDQPKIKADIKQMETYRACLYTGFITTELKQYIPELTYSLTVLQ